MYRKDNRHVASRGVEHEQGACWAKVLAGRMDPYIISTCFKRKIPNTAAISMAVIRTSS